MTHWKPDLFDRDNDELDIERREPRCNRCGSPDVRWRQQGGRWVLFSLTPGQEHACEINADGFGKVEE